METTISINTKTTAKASSFQQMLIDSGILSEEQLATVQDTAKREGVPLLKLLARDGLVLSRDLAALTALHLGIPLVDLRSQSIDQEGIATIPEQMARKHLILPIAKEGNRLTVAMADPLDYKLLHDLVAFTGLSINPVIATMDDILEHIDVIYRITENSEENLKDGSTQSSKVTASLILESPPAYVIELLLRQAIQDRASDIHIEPSETRLRIRFRIDGILHDIMNFPPEVHPTLISRLKIMSGMNIAERRRPQDGQFTAEAQGRKVDVRVAISNTVTGEIAVLRLLDKKFTLLGLDQLGMNGQNLTQVRRLLRLPYGMVIVCGPTGAGKSTTLYASILQMNRQEQKIISIEDPVEYRITDVNQMQVNSEAGVTFASQLRSILRLDPNVILVGEIRDQETALIATQAALTGHLVLTSLHANDSVSALLRLRDLGVAPYLVASSVAGIISQRMVRVVCNGCKTIQTRPTAEKEAYQIEMGEARDQFVTGTGCNLCAHTGYKGRTGVFEILNMSEGLRQLFLTEAPRSQLWKQATQEGMVPLRKGGMMKVKEGITSPYEILRVLFSLD